MNPAVLSLLLAAITTIIAFAMLKLGVAVGRHQEFLARTKPLLEELVWIEAAVTARSPIAHASLGYRIRELLKKYGLTKKSA